MKILIVTHIANLSGANKSLLSIIEKLKDKAEFVVLVNEKKGELIDSLEELKIKTIYQNYHWWYSPHRDNFCKRVLRFVVDGFKYYTHRGIGYTLLKEIKGESFDLVYTNTSTVNFGAIIAEKLNLPHIWHIREFGKEDFGFTPLVRRKYMLRMFQSAKYIITISNALKDKFKDNIDSSKLKVIYNGFNVEQLSSIKRSHDFSKEINILIAGQVCSAKGQNQAISATNKLIEYGIPVKLYIAGDVDEKYLNDILIKYPNHDWIVRLGSVKNMYELRNNIDIELVCSRSEAFGRVTLEAMLHCIPVIGSKTGGTVELINNNNTGLLYEYDNVNELAECILNLINNKTLYISIVNNAFDFAKKFTIQKTTDDIFKIFRDSVL
ncbi:MULTISPECIES: glycosyltransferase family 4 protein [Clostridium]|uniref:glycosyltransferase family 4 protein n=1 Tax=Clostridium TaxID=1485 RepID=UPI00036CDFEC|nr:MULTISPECIES: glycosyltransferase family 4 protein [Clostridium]MBN1036873.1 glycosyltransferase family 1 protein [Clostridium botulinum]MBY7026493.1 glycosyltransferase family 4 protein [Clostridium botulinum]